MDKVLYSEGKGLLELSIGFGVASLIVFVAGFFIKGGLGAIMVIIGLLGSIAGITIWSMSRYSLIELTSKTLRVGQDRLSLDELDKSYGAKHGEEALSQKQVGRIEIDITRPGVDDIRVMGGSWGRIKGTRWVIVRLNKGSRAAISTMYSDELVKLLNQVLAVKNQ